MNGRGDPGAAVSGRPRADGTPRWEPLTVLRPPLGGAEARPLLLNAAGARAVSVHHEALFDLLAEQFGGQTAGTTGSAVAERLLELGFLRSPEEGAAPSPDPRFEHWWRRGWHPALDYYLWSRAAHFTDRDDPDARVRREVLAGYVGDDGPPPPRLEPREEGWSLPRPQELPDRPLGRLVMDRRTVRSFGAGPVPLQVLSNVLWHGLHRVRRCRDLSAADPLSYLKSYGVAFDVFVVVYDVEDLHPGVYFYRMVEHAFVPVRQGSFRSEMTTNLFGQSAPQTAAWTLILVADYDQYQWRYRHERALRNLYIEAGRIAHECLLVAAACGLGTLVTPAMRDRAVTDLLRIDPVRQSPVYSLTMGPDRRHGSHAY